MEKKQETDGSKSDKKEADDKKSADKKTAEEKITINIENLIHKIMLLFVELGNPTPDSENNRHNIGFKIIDAINKNLDFQNKNQNLRVY